MRRWILAIAVLFVAGCGPATVTAPQQGGPAVTVAHPVRMETADYADYTGSLAAIESVEIRARVQGFLEKIHFQPSSIVEPGQLLFEIEQAPFLTRLAFANAKVSSREADLALAEAQLKRRVDLVERGAITQEELDEAQAEREVAAAALQEAEATVDQAQIDLAYTRILAPIGGTIGRNLVDVGNLVGGVDQTLLTSIVNTDEVYAYFEISERDALEYLREALGKGQGRTKERNYPVRLGLLDETGFPHKGHIDYVDNTFSAQTGTIEVRGIFPNTAGVFQPGMFVRVRIEGNREERLLVNERALAADLGGSYVLVVGDDNIVEVQRVRTGQIVDGMRVILPNDSEQAGTQDQLTDSDRYIVTGLQRARPGLPVSPTIEADTQSPPAAQAPVETPSSETPPEEPASDGTQP